MIGLYIGSTDAFAGKNIVLMALGLEMQRRGMRVGYMKPVGSLPKRVDDVIGDEDAIVIQELLGLEISPDILTPVIIPDNLRVTTLSDETDALAAIQSAYNTISKDKDVMLVGGCGSIQYTGTHRGVDGLTLSRKLGLKTLLVDRYRRNRLNYDAILNIKKTLGDDMLGILFNDVPEDFSRDAEDILIPFLEKNDVDVFGMVPRDPMLNAIKASELSWRLKGKIISGNSQSQRIIQNFLIGTMQVENFMTYFRQSSNLATIVGGDRTDLQLIAMEGGCPCLIVTGNITPNEIVRARSEQLGVPVIQVPDDTYSVARSMELILNSQKLRELVKIKRGAELVDNSFDYNKLCKKLARQSE
ncbi:DRTGG domain-containing protein [Halodesulfovibrio sp.]|jgi:BioD-like phosphotransacetylase family protein|uniref:DRTGG domain-containing protein n=1 Tax=Halodesulfovibrio sp. TaxID=1912772 RepID=UPI0025D27CAE|nr:DRTGG domain-containing protein [Halodesulfovibrio sp.]MCT4626623.1 DRTGG domain-containing protein [Halodesulfovibrio sp.]